MHQRTCAAPECGNGISGHAARRYCSTRCRKDKEVAGRSAEYRRHDAEARKAARQRDKLNPAKVAKERERQRLKAERKRLESLPGWRSLANDLPRDLDAEMDAVMLWRYVECGWCGAFFWTKRADALSCSLRCKRSAKRMRRRARECNATGTYTWAEVVKVYRQIGRVCAYCHEHFPLADIEPDHVVALSVGGSNSIHNVVPSCMPCNADKRELSIDAWNVDRARRELPSRALHPEISHLTSVLLAA